MEQLNRFIRLARVFLEGRGMPFLGAGISMSASPPNCADWKPTVGWMVGALIEKCLPGLLNNIPNKQKELAAYLGAKPKELNQYPFDKADELHDKLKELTDNRLGILCEGLCLLEILDHNAIVAALRIKDYAGLLPTPAHYFIALLVSETLVNEAITTNYDCCLERAVNHCRGDEGNGQPNACVSQPSVSIKDLETYRQVAARSLSPGRRSVTLRVYKINGCAGTLSHNSAHARHILLTERQLQHMDDRAWARDLLRDRARAKALVFTGFGSDEPQVKFTLQRLQEEFKTAGQPEDAEDANSLWVHAFTQQLSTTQLDILKGFWGYRTRTYKKYFFSGSDAGKIERYSGLAAGQDKDKDKKLSADFFWQTLFQVVFLGLIERYTWPGSSGWFFLGELDDPSRPVKRKNRLQKWLDPGGVGELVMLQNGGIADTLGQPLARVHSLLGFQENIRCNRMSPERKGIPLCLYLRALEGRPLPGHDAKLAEVYYQPLIRQIKPILALLCLACFCVPNDTKSKTQPELPFEVAFPFGGQPNINRPMLFLFNRPGLRLLLATEKRQDIFETAAGNQPHVTMLAGYLRNGAPFFPDMSEEWAAVEVTGAATIRVRRLAPVSIQDILFVYQSVQDKQERKTGSSDDKKEQDVDPVMSPEIVTLLERRTGSQIPKPLHHAVLTRSAPENEGNHDD